MNASSFARIANTLSAADAIAIANAHGACFDASTPADALAHAILSTLNESGVRALVAGCTTPDGAKRAAQVFSMAARIQREAIAAFKAKRAADAKLKAQGVKVTKTEYPKTLSAYSNFCNAVKRQEPAFTLAQVTAKVDGEGYEDCKAGDTYYKVTERKAKDASGDGETGEDSATIREAKDDITAEQVCKQIRQACKVPSRSNRDTLAAFRAMAARLAELEAIHANASATGKAAKTAKRKAA